MAGPLYARYAPPKASIQTKAQKLPRVAEVQDENEAHTQADLPRKRKRRDDNEGHSRKKNKSKSNEDQRDRPTIKSETTATQIQRLAAVKQNLGGAATKPERKPPTLAAEQGHDNCSTETEERKKQKRKGAHNKDIVERDTAEPSLGHSKILSRFEKAIKAQPREPEKSENAERPPAEAPELHDLVPIPVPDPPTQAIPQSAFSLLPAWLSKPFSVSSQARVSFEDLQIDRGLLAKLHQKGFINALPVQGGVLPLLLPIPTQHPGDLCVSAATGSGKTLAYVLPVVQSLMAHLTTSLRAVIIVPTRELVDQVCETAEMCCLGTRLHVGTAVGTQHFETEQSTLVEKGRRYDPLGYKQLRERLMRQAINQDGDTDSDDSDELDSARALSSLLPDHVPHYSSKVDILITTPGRLVEHIKSTLGLSLSNLEWLVIDEADRLLDESFQEWVETLSAATDVSQRHGSTLAFPAVRNAMGRRRPPRKVVLSATMTRDLDKLSRLRLKNPRMVVIEATEEQSTITPTMEDKGIEIPVGLEEYGIPVGDGSEKPLLLASLLDQILGECISSKQNKVVSPPTPEALIDKHDADTSGTDDSDSDSSSAMGSDQISPSASPSPSLKSVGKVLSNALVFTSTNESAHRLSRLLAHLRPKHENSLSTLTKSSTSRSTLRALSSFRSSDVRILIATDRASRGLDLPNLQNVINYDIPHSVTSYVHRVGRTARAGGKGKAWTLVEDRQAAFFWKEIARGEEIDRAGRTVERKKMDLKDLGDGAREKYQMALEALEKEVKGK